MPVETRLTEANQTQVPAALRARHGLAPGDLVVWEEDADGVIRVRFRKRHTMADLMAGLPGSEGGPKRDAVLDKKRAQRGEL